MRRDGTLVAPGGREGSEETELNLRRRRKQKERYNEKQRIRESFQQDRRKITTQKTDARL